MVGRWNLEINLRGLGDAFVSQCQGDLYVCGSARGDSRATGAFLVVRQWSAGSADSRQLEQLYASLSVAALERLDSLLGGVPNEGGGRRDCVLYLVDARNGAGPFRLDRLQSRLLEELEGEHPIPGVDMLVAHGRGTGTRPHGLALPAPPAAEARSAARASEGDGRSSGHSRRRGVHRRKPLSPENLRWNRQRELGGGPALVAATEDPAPALPARYAARCAQSSPSGPSACSRWATTAGCADMAGGGRAAAARSTRSAKARRIGTRRSR